MPHLRHMQVLPLALSHFFAQCRRGIVIPTLLLLCLLGGRAHAASGGPPAFADAVAANPVTNKVYVADTGSGTVTVLDGITGATSTINTGGTPRAIAVNPVTNKIYVTNTANHGVAVIDGALNTFVTVSVPAGDAPIAVAVNPVTNKIYVVIVNTTTFNGGVMVIDGASNGTTFVTDANAHNPVDVAVNSVTNKIYVTNDVSNNVTVIDGASNATTTVAVGRAPGGVAVNPQTNRIYVINNNIFLPGTVSVIDGASNTVLGSQIPVGGGPFGPAVNPATNKIYVANWIDGTVSVIDGASNSTTTVAAGNGPMAVAVNPVNNRIYVANNGDNTVTVINGASHATSTVPGGNAPHAVAVNPMTGRVYVADSGASDVTVIGGATMQADTIEVPLQVVADGPYSHMVVNPVTNQVYTIGANLAVTVIDGASNVITKLADGTGVRSLAANPVTNAIYAINQSGGVTVIAGATSTQPASVVATLTLSSFSLDIALNPATNRLYVSGQDGTVTVLDGTTSNVIAKIAVGVPLYVLAANPTTNKIYGVTNSYPSGPNETLVLDGTSNAVIATLAMTSPYDVVVNPLTNRIYVDNFAWNGDVSVIDGASDAIVATIPAQLPQLEAVNPVTNKVYVTNASVEAHLPFQGTMVIDGASNTVIATVPAGASASPTPSVIAIAVNPLTNHVYIGTEQLRFPLAPSPSTISVIDGISDTIGAVLGGDDPDAIVVNPVTNQIYVADAAPWASSFVTKIDEQQTQFVPLPVNIAFLGQPGVDFVGESTVSHNPAFQFWASSYFLPLGMPIQNIYYQVDTWQGVWQSATPSGLNFTGQLSSVSPGNHVLYAYASDGEDATLWPGNSLIGTVAAFPFTVVQALTQVSLAPQSLNGSPDPYHSTVNVVGSGFQPGDTLQIVFRNLPDVIPPDAPCIVCSALHSHLEDVLAPSFATVSSDGTFQVREVVAHNIENGSGFGPVTILVKSTGMMPGIVEATGEAGASYWIGPMPADN